MLRTRFPLFHAASCLLVAMAVAPRARGAGAPLETGVPGGLWVQLGAVDPTPAVAAAQSGRFLTMVLGADNARVEDLQRQFHEQSLYGLLSVDVLPGRDQLPFSENLVNVLVVEGARPQRVPQVEWLRVLCPLGALVVSTDLLSAADMKTLGLVDIRAADAGGRWIMGRKPWPKQMDQWPQPRRTADNNAVSRDELAGPPRRIRWVSGPPQEISNMVTAEGRCYYGGVLARDGFNGLRLWARQLTPSPARGGFNYASAPGGVRPLAVGSELAAFDDGLVRVLDGGTGATLRTYPAAGKPTDLVYVDGLLLAIDSAAITAVTFADGKLRWRRATRSPRCVAAGDGGLFFLEGDLRRGDAPAIVRLDLTTGDVVWRRSDLQWLAGVRNCVHHCGLLACELSTLADEKQGNRVELLAAADGASRWNRAFVPGMAHKKQARALFVGDLLWVLDDKVCRGLDLDSGDAIHEAKAGSGHCFPPVVSGYYLFAGEMDFTDLRTLKVDANRITKGACGRDAGVTPANGLIYTSPKHCNCWPMLRDYAALAPARPDRRPGAKLEPAAFHAERGPAVAPSECKPTKGDWPCYRHDAWRSGATEASAPADLKTVWTTELGELPSGPIAADWSDNPFGRFAVTPPVVAGGTVYAARPHAHQVVALRLADGRRMWSFTANGRVDTPPTIHRGLCLFGARSGWVFCLRADDGQLVWRLRVAPHEERIVSYGQVESPWPVPGSVLVIDDVAFFAAGRQSLADGGIRVFAVRPATGEVLWVQRLDSVPQTHFYSATGLEFDNFDLLQREGDAVSMSRWLFDRRSGAMTCKAKSGFVRAAVGEGGSVMAPRGVWSYAPRAESEQSKERPFLRAPAVFTGSQLYGCSEDRRQVFRRDFHLEDGEEFNDEWFNRWKMLEEARKGGPLWRNDLLAKGASWKMTPLPDEKQGAQAGAIALAAERLYVVGGQGGLSVVSAADGTILAQRDLPAPVWDGAAVVAERLVVSLASGAVTCCAAEKSPR